MRCLPALGLLLLLAPGSAAAQGGRMLSPGQMEEDLFLLSDTLERLHAGRLRYVTAEELDEVFGEALSRVSEERTGLEFFRIVSGVVSALRCGHTRVQPSGLVEREVLDAAGLLPCEVLLDGERAWILRSYDEALPAGAELGAIDGRSIEEIRAIAFGRMSDDGFIETGKERQLERDFGRLYVLLVQDPERIGGGYEVRLAGASGPVRVAGMSPAALAEQRPSLAPRPLTSLELFPDQDLGVLMVSAFGDRPEEKPFLDQLEESFVRLEQSGVGNLVLDLRGNGGGEDVYGAALVSYLATRPYGYFERIEVTPEYEGPGGIVEKDGMRLVTEHPGLDGWKPAEHAFAGEKFVLTDGWTFSTAADVATVAHWNGFATFVGEETGGGYDGNTSGVSEKLLLPDSGLAVNVPMWMYTTANVGHAFTGRGVIPDHRVRPTISDALAGRDTELDFVRGLIRGE